MGEGLASVDGCILPIFEATVPATDPGFQLGWTVFDTLEVRGGEVPGLFAHLARLEASAAAALVPLPPMERLADWTRALAAAHGGLGRLRVTVSGSGRCVLTVVDVEPGRRGAPVRAVRGPHRAEPFLGGSVKHGSRAPWVVAVRRAGVDEVLLVDEQGRFTEGTTSGVIAVVDGTLWTAPHDDRILASTTVTGLVEAAIALGVPVRREGPLASGPWDGLYIASATRGLAPVVELDGEVLPGWEPVGRRLADAT